MTSPYDDFEQALTSIVPPEDLIFGHLGFTVDTVYGVLAGINKSHLYRVRLDDGSFQEIEHRGNCSPTPDMKVILKLDDRFNTLYIEGPDQTWLAENSSSTSGQYSVSHHSHSRGSGMEFTLDLRMITQFFIELQGALTIFIRQGLYYYNGVTKYWAGDSIDLVSYRPTAPGKYRWVIVCLNPADNTIVVVAGADLEFISESIGVERIAEIDVVGRGYVPIVASLLKYGMSRLSDEQLHSMMNTLNVPTLQTPQFLYQNTLSNASSTGTWTAILWTEKYDPLGYIMFDNPRVQIKLVAGDWILLSLKAHYVQASGLDGNLAVRFRNLTESVTLMAEGSAVLDTDLEARTFNPTITPTPFVSNGTDDYALEIQATSNEFINSFPVVLELQKILETP